MKEISRKVSKIQDPSLSDFMIRDLNDEINKAMREKYMWEVQIRNLGGPNYMRGGGKVYDEEGREIPGGGKGYKCVVFLLQQDGGMLTIRQVLWTSKRASWSQGVVRSSNEAPRRQTFRNESRSAKTS